MLLRLMSAICATFVAVGCHGSQSRSEPPVQDQLARQLTEIEALKNKAAALAAGPCGKESPVVTPKCREALDEIARETAALMASNALPITYMDYDALYTEQSYQRVLSTLWHLPKEVSRSSIGDITTIAYRWDNPDGSNIMAVFQNDRLVSKAQAGLK
jgi:hypothetical protein